MADPDVGKPERQRTRPTVDVPPSVLTVLSERIGEAPRVSLREEASQAAGSPVIDPASMRRLTFSTALMPPKYLVTFSTRIMGAERSARWESQPWSHLITNFRDEIAGKTGRYRGFIGHLIGWISGSAMCNLPAAGGCVILSCFR